MNYYEHHLGDYAKDTAHLTMLEDGAYRRLLDRYYGTESGIPAAQAHRIARARTREEKQAVDAVLEEFFFLVEGAWKNNRAEEEIKKFSDKKPKADEKRENDKERQRRARERRKALFEELSGLGVHMPWNATTEELHASLEHAKSQPSHKPVTPPVTRDNTANQTPDTRHQTPDSKQPPPVTEPELRAESVEVAVIPYDNIAIPETPTTEGHWMAWFNRETGTQFDASSRFDRSDLWPIFSRWCKAGITQQQMRAAIQTAQATATAPIANLPKYVDRVLASSQTPQRISHSDQSKLAASRAIFGTEIEGEQHGQSNRIIDITPTDAEIGSG